MKITSAVFSHYITRSGKSQAPLRFFCIGRRSLGCEVGLHFWEILPSWLRKIPTVLVKSCFLFDQSCALLLNVAIPY
jgi:hypothetical protein